MKELPTITPWLYRGFLRYLRFYLRRNLDGVRVSKAGLRAAAGGSEDLASRVGERAVLVVANHPSWWDPLLFGLVTDALLPDRPIYGPMEAEALERYGVFRRLGVFGVEDGPRGARRFLEIGRAILETPRSVLWVTAEGQLTDPRVRPVRLERGVSHLARRVPAALVLPAALEVVLWDERLPEALVRFGEPVTVDADEPPAVDEIHQRIERALEAAMDALAEESTARDPERFVSLLDGARGTGGLYDLARRIRALVKGERYDDAHSTLVRREK